LHGEGVGRLLVAVGKLEDDEEENDRKQVEQKFHAVPYREKGDYAGSKRRAAELMQ
jgi:hypothetical protein